MKFYLGHQNRLLKGYWWSKEEVKQLQIHLPVQVTFIMNHALL